MKNLRNLKKIYKINKIIFECNNRINSDYILIKYKFCY